MKPKFLTEVCSAQYLYQFSYASIITTKITIQVTQVQRDRNALY